MRKKHRRVARKFEWDEFFVTWVDSPNGSTNLLKFASLGQSGNMRPSNLRLLVYV
jgi:hypothetical protein